MTQLASTTFFNQNWKKYQNSISHNTLYHKEMMAALTQFFAEKLPTPFSMVDVGCGDCSTIVPVLSQTNIATYVGIDAAPEVIQLAQQNMQAIHCQKEFICDNMINAIKVIPQVDLIFESYAVHHLSTQQKFDFIQQAKGKLKSNGYLVMIDCVLRANQERHDWLNEIEDRIKTTQQLSKEELAFHMDHIRNNDDPDSVQTFQAFAEKQQWKSFDVWVDKGIFAFMIFTK